MPVELRPPAPALWRAAALLAALAIGVLAGCPFELPHAFSCGDGWVDPEFEACDPRDPSNAHVNACRDLGYDVDATCDPQTCKILTDVEDCNSCGDGIAAEDEACDGDDLRGSSCVAGTLRCKDDCTLDYDDCPTFCGDTIVNGDEECEFADVCAGDDDCQEGTICYQGSCVAAGENFLPNLACSDYATSAVGKDKPYTTGTISTCVKDGCKFGRNDCSFCGDNEIDGKYFDVAAPDGANIEFQAEICDGDAIPFDKHEEFCAQPCGDGFNMDVHVLCDVECRDDCSGLRSAGDIVPGQDPEDFGCCLAKGSPCPKFGIIGVPEYPCCSWLENPKWLEEEKCVLGDSQKPPMLFFCP